MPSERVKLEMKENGQRLEKMELTGERKQKIALRQSLKKCMNMRSSCSLYSQGCTYANLHIQTHIVIYFLYPQTLHIYTISSYSSFYTNHVSVHTHKYTPTNRTYIHTHTHTPPPCIFPLTQESINRISAKLSETNAEMKHTNTLKTDIGTEAV